MKQPKILITTGTLLVNLLFSGALLAHTELSESSPSNDSVINEIPRNLDLNFTEDVNLLKVALRNSEEQEIEIEFIRSSEASSHFAVVIPSLEEGSYEVSWTVLGSDSHRVEGEFSFTFDTGAAESMGHSGVEHDEHAHAHDGH